MALPSRSSQGLGRQAHEWTILKQGALDTVMTHDVPGECEHWVVGRQRQGAPTMRTEQTNTPQAKKPVRRMCFAQPSQLQLLTVRRLVQHQQLMQLFQDNQQSLEQDAQEEKVKKIVHR